MRRSIKWLLRILGLILGLAVLVVLVAWIGGGVVAERTYDIPSTTFAMDAQTVDIEEGRRIAHTLGCLDGCHGDGLSGNVFFDNPWIGTFIAPDLTQSFANLSDAELDSAIRHGVRSNGKSTFIMPSSGLHHLSDEDLNNIAGFIRSQPVSDGLALEASPGLMARAFLLIGEFVPRAQEVLDDAPWLSGSPTRYSPDAGKYLALISCAECHGMDFQGQADFAPSLAAVVAYSLEDFQVLMNTGVAIGNRELDLMQTVATRRFAHFTDSEVEALHSYLRTLAGSD